MNSLLLFDIDGTLLQHNKHETNYWTTALSEMFQIKPIYSNWSNYKNKIDTAIFQEIFESNFKRSPNVVELDSFKNNILSRFKKDLSHNPKIFREVHGASIFLNKLIRIKNMKAGIATGNWMEIAKLKLLSLNVSWGSGFIGGFSENGATRGDIIKYTIDKFKKCYGEFNKIIYVGDAEWDYKAAKYCGIDFIGITTDNNFDKFLKSGVKKERLFTSFNMSLENYIAGLV
ncbi:HAD family hydrolase [Wolbachia endosymbiont of Ctenocephalides felis wCfeJ]|uniref:HAD family hydrolase n=1 Tax=Wolbachia endosymbiont of Ctenocephalides felis wCfeJ TaxID=2732594 RepID=UPI00144638EA|nr:HAD hydrolase-like protein [Wolbachia endosymbiont of Ctenocephalides felis wCfeJ]WCR58467.1 MAG: hypothetical protein PG980_000939 [Wolbachia endosymbiont of Ctenocephalides felis wCfeJ]